MFLAFHMREDPCPPFSLHFFPQSIYYTFFIMLPQSVSSALLLSFFFFLSIFDYIFVEAFVHTRQCVFCANSPCVAFATEGDHVSLKGR